MNEDQLLERLDALVVRHVALGEQISDPEVIGNQKRYVKLMREYKELEPLLVVHGEYKNLVNNLVSNREMLREESDAEMREMAKMEIDELVARKPLLEEEIKILLLPKDPEDNKNAVIEIRGGTGGDEASLFAGELARMYTKYCEGRGWKVQITSFTEGSVGGFKEIVMSVDGAGVYGIMKYESGVHRVQRVPQTETQGRVHTSAATVAILPEAEEFDVQINQHEIRKDTYCSSGPGGQSVNTTYSAIRLTHIPSGIVVTCQDQKSQLKNLDKAMRELRTRIYNIELQKHNDEIASKRKTLVSSGDRSAKIRTYNFPQGRMTDHRINLTLFSLNSIMDGDIQEIIDKLTIAENTERLKDLAS